MLHWQEIRDSALPPSSGNIAVEFSFFLFFFASKINVSLRWLILCLYTNQVKVLLSKQRICHQRREQLAPVTSIRGLFVLGQ